MTNRQIQLIQESWEKMKPVSRSLVARFYQDLFDEAPEYREMFKEDLTVQSAKMAAMLQFIVGKLSRFEDILYDIRALGESHQGYGLDQAAYDITGRCLLQSMAETIPDHWDSETEQAWLLAYNEIVAAMHVPMKS